MNDISDTLLSSSRLFADDTSLSCSASNISDIEGIMNHDLAMWSDWSKQWLISFNPMKTEAMLFSNQTPYSLSVFKSRILQTFNVLGVGSGGLIPTRKTGYVTEMV